MGRPYRLLAVFILVGGTNWVVLKTALRHVGPFTFATLSTAVAAAGLVAVLHLTGGLRLPSRGEGLVIAVVGLLQIALFSVLVFFGLQRIDAGVAAVLAFTTPLWVAPGAALFLGETLTRLKLAAAFTGLLGIAAIAAPWALGRPDEAALTGAGLLIAAAALWSASILIVRGRRSWRLSPFQLAPWQLVLAALTLAPFAVLLEGGQPVHWPAVLIAALAWNAVVGTAFGVWASVELARRLPALTLALATLWLPVVALTSGALLLDEPLRGNVIAGLALIALANGLVILADRRAASPEAIEPESRR